MNLNIIVLVISLLVCLFLSDMNNYFKLSTRERVVFSQYKIIIGYNILNTGSAVMTARKNKDSGIQ